MYNDLIYRIVVYSNFFSGFGGLAYYSSLPIHHSILTLNGLQLVATTIGTVVNAILVAYDFYLAIKPNEDC